jgi:hypothetical protein
MNKSLKWLRPVIPAGAILFALVLGLAAQPSRAQDTDNLVRVDPSGILVAPDGTFHISVLDDPPEQTLAAWVIEMTFDPSVIESQECISISTPGGAVGAFDCEFSDDNNDGKNENVKMLGAVLFSRSGKGLVNESKLADITFHAIGGPADCSDFTLRILIHADSDGSETGAKVQDGRMCIAGDAPASGTVSPVPITPRTSEPTPEGGGPIPTLNPVGGNTGGSSGGADNSGSSNGASGSRTSGPSGSRTAGGSSSSQPSGGGATNNDDDTKTFVWVVVGAAALIIAAAGAWGVVRMRNRGGPDDGTPPPV